MGKSIPSNKFGPLEQNSLKFENFSLTKFIEGGPFSVSVCLTMLDKSLKRCDTIHTSYLMKMIIGLIFA